MAHVEERERARALRQQGESIREISRKLRSSKSTVSYWCRDIALSPQQIRLLVRKKERGAYVGRLRAAEKKRASRMNSVASEMQKGAADIGKLDTKSLFALGLGLYWGEGYKSGNEECGFTNSNPDIILAFMTWLWKIYKIPSKDLVLRVSVNDAHEKREKEILRYWSNITGIPLKQFTKTSFVRTRSRKVYANPERHFGTLRVKVRRGTTLRRRILGSIAEAARQIQEM